MTTIASGFCVSLPMPLETAAGISPIAAINAVMTTGRTLDWTPSTDCPSGGFVVEILFEYGNQDHPILNTDSKQRDKSDTCRYTENRTGKV